MKMLLGSFCVASVYGAQESKEDEPISTWPEIIGLPCSLQSGNMWQERARQPTTLHLAGRPEPGHKHPQGLFRPIDRVNFLAMCKTGFTGPVRESLFSQTQGSNVGNLLLELAGSETIDGMKPLPDAERFNGRKKVVVEGFELNSGQHDFRLVDSKAAIDESKVYVHWIDTESAWVLYPELQRLEPYRQPVPGNPRYRTVAQKIYNSADLPNDVDHYWMNHTLAKLTIQQTGVARVDDASWQSTYGMTVYRCDARIYNKHPRDHHFGIYNGNHASTGHDWVLRDPQLRHILDDVAIPDPTVYEKKWLVQQIIGENVGMFGNSNSALSDKIADYAEIHEPDQFLQDITKKHMAALAQRAVVLANAFCGNLKKAAEGFKMRQRAAAAAEDPNDPVDDLSGSIDVSDFSVEEKTDFDPLYSNADAINIHLARLRSMTDMGDGGEMDELD